MLAERGPEAVIPLGGGARAQGLLSYANRALGRGSGSGATNVTFAPNVTINGNASAAEQKALDSSLRSLATDFIKQFKAAQQQERRLSYESGYA
jgi:carbon monoxide dehydrogenase subunit G